MAEKLLGILDLVSTVWLVLLQYATLPVTVSWVLGLYLIIKAVTFRDLSSMIDGISGVLLLFAAYGHTSFLTTLAVLWLLQKGIISLARTGR